MTTNHNNLTIVDMTVEAFSAIPDNPRQRDTERHAKKAKRSHLAKASPAQACVSIATINGTPICKQDGHTRSWMWDRGELERPERLIVVCYPVRSLEEAAELYTHFDNQSAVEGSGDRLFGACREHGLVLSSSLLHRYDFATALKFAHGLRPASGAGSLDEYALVGKWCKCLREFDALGLSKHRFRGSGLVSLGLVAIASMSFSPETISSFYKSFNDDSGVKEGKRRDGVQALSEHMEQRRFANQMTGYENLFDMMSKGYSCLKAWSESAMIHNVQPSREALLKLHAKARANIDKGLFESE